MTKHIVEIEVIEADEGYILTNGETCSNIIFLGSMDNAENWTEVPIENEKEEQI